MHAHGLSQSFPVSAFSALPAMGEMGQLDFDMRRARSPSSRSPRFVQSVVEEAGFGRFVYLYGASGRRYVFSAIEAEQAWLYEGAIFAMTCEQGDRITFSRLPPAEEGENGNSQRMFVHLLADDEGTGGVVLADLANSEFELAA